LTLQLGNLSRERCRLRSILLFQIRNSFAETVELQIKKEQ